MSRTENHIYICIVSIDMVTLIWYIVMCDVILYLCINCMNPYYLQIVQDFILKWQNKRINLNSYISFSTDLSKMFIKKETWIFGCNKVLTIYNSRKTDLPYLCSVEVFILKHTIKIWAVLKPKGIRIII